MASSTVIKYNNSTLHTSVKTETVRLVTTDKIMAGDVVIESTIEKVAGNNDVEFIDYNGNVVDSYTAAEFSELTELPANPSHEGLTAQGWNWTLADAKSFVSSYGRLIIGQSYVTNDNKTRLYITLGSVRLSPYLGIAVKGTATIDWGDGTSDTITGSSLSTVIYTQHVYAAAGDYVIVLTGNIGFGNRTLLRVSNSGSASDYDIVYTSALTKVELGNVTQIQGSAFYNCYSLSEITIPSTVTTIGTNVFRSCRSLYAVVVPKNVTKIQASCFLNCFSLRDISLNRGITQIQNNGFGNCYSLKHIILPNTVTSLADNSFTSNFSLAEVLMPDSVTTIGTKSFYTCNSLLRVRLSNSITTLTSNIFYNCFALSEINVPTSLVSFDSGVFYDCYTLSSLVIPSGVTTISSQTFYQCQGLGYIRFLPTTPPTVAASDAFNSLPADCIIYVPNGTLTAYTTATNYPSSATYTYVEDAP